MNVTIEKLVYGGDGLARVAGDDGRNKTLFVPFTLPGEDVLVTNVREKKGFGRAELRSVLAPSAARVDPGCPYFFRCGGCHYQHAAYPLQLESKRGILREALNRGAKLDWPGEIIAHAAEPWHYRNRTRMHVRGSGADFRMGYYRHGSHELLAIERCPISSHLINRAISVIGELGRDAAMAPAISEIEYFANGEDSQLLLELYLSAPMDAALRKQLDDFARQMEAALPEFLGAAAFATGDFSNTALWQWGASHLDYRTGGHSYRVSAGSFFQVNRFLTAQMISLACAGQNGRRALDLFAGTGLFTLELAKAFNKVIAVESAPASFADLVHNAPSNVKPRNATTEQYLQSAADLECDLVLVDPPRAGLGPRVTDQLGKMRIERLAYVSCDPTTLARDLHSLLTSGFQVTEIHLLDLFPQTFHVETLVHLSR